MWQLSAHSFPDARRASDRVASLSPIWMTASRLGGGQLRLEAHRVLADDRGVNGLAPLDDVGVRRVGDGPQESRVGQDPRALLRGGPGDLVERRVRARAGGQSINRRQTPVREERLRRQQIRDLARWARPERRRDRSIPRSSQIGGDGRLILGGPPGRGEKRRILGLVSQMVDPQPLRDHAGDVGLGGGQREEPIDLGQDSQPGSRGRRCRPPRAVRRQASSRGARTRAGSRPRRRSERCRGSGRRRRRSSSAARARSDRGTKARG